jgi:hypothetical protein
MRAVNLTAASLSLLLCAAGGTSAGEGPRRAAPCAFVPWAALHRGKGRHISRAAPTTGAARVVHTGACFRQTAVKGPRAASRPRAAGRPVVWVKCMYCSSASPATRRLVLESEPTSK